MSERNQAQGFKSISVPVASTCYWETDPPTYVDTYGSGYSGRLNDLIGAISRWRLRDGETGFEAQLARHSILSLGSKPEKLYRGESLEDAVAALNERLDILEHEEGFVPSPRNDLPKRLDPDALIVGALEAESLIDRELREHRERREQSRRRGPVDGSGGGTPKL